MPQSEAQKPDNESKSQRKKDMVALQKIGESLIQLTEKQLVTMDLPDNLLTAIQHMKSLTSNEAKRRQLQYIGKIMRQIDPDSIKQALSEIEFIQEKNTTQFHHIEEWRSKLFAHGNDALNSFLVNYPKVDRQQLRQLIRNVQQDRMNEKNTGAEKALFKYLRLIIENIAYLNSAINDNEPNLFDAIICYDVKNNNKHVHHFGKGSFSLELIFNSSFN